jgi:formylglycine-generating enzyme required for sulfatase activity
MIQASKERPFPGLRPFEFEDRAFFFGREEQIQTLYQKLRQNQFLAVIGASGSGKSSLVKAGLLGQLSKLGHSEARLHWTTISMRPFGHPLWQLAHAVAIASSSGQPPLERDQVALAADRAIAKLSRSSAGLVELLRELRANTGNRLLIIVDQFEELFRYLAGQSDTAFDERALFVKNLLSASNESELRTHILITMRSKFVGDCAQFRDLPEAINDSQFLTPRLTRDQRKEAVLGPLHLADGNIAPALLQRILNDAGQEPHQLPVMQHALMRTWQGVFPSRTLTMEAYEAIGGMDSAISQHADALLQKLSIVQRADTERLFRALTDTDKDGRATRRPTRFGDLADLCSTPEAAATLIDTFRDDACAFLSPNQSVPIENDTVVDISHETLIRKWAALATWVVREVEDALIFSRLHELAGRRKADPEIVLAPKEASERNRWWQAVHPDAAWAKRYLPKDDGVRFPDVRELLEMSVMSAARDAEYVSGLERQAKEAQLEAERLLRERAEREVRGKDYELQLAQMGLKLAEAQRQNLASQPSNRVDSGAGNIYISYSHFDRLIAVEIYDWLLAHGVENIFLDINLSRDESEPSKDVKQAIQFSSIVILLISSSWISSRFCRDEFLCGHASGKELLPVLIDPNVSLLNLAKLQPPISAVRVAKWQEGSSGKDLLLAQLRRLGIVFEFFWFEPGRKPYPGLIGFDERDAAIFFGRSAQIIEAMGRLRSFQSRGGSHFMVILGASGSGKSSFLRAGLWPRLRRDGASFFCLPIFRPSAWRHAEGDLAIIAAIRRAVENEAGLDKNGFDRDNNNYTADGHFGVETIEGHLIKLSEQLTRKLHGEQDSASVTVVLALDQAEELFRLEYYSRSCSFLKLGSQLIERNRAPIIVLLSIRSDSFERVQANEFLGNLTKDTFDLPPIPFSSLRSVIEGPARVVGLSLDPALTDALLIDLQGGHSNDALPLLSFTLERRYTGFGGESSLKLAHYQMLGGYRGALEAAVERALTAANANPAIPRDIFARRALLRRGLIPWLAGIDPETLLPRRRIALMSEIPLEARPLIEHLVEQRLLTTDIAAEIREPTVEFVHEALLRQWGLLQGWLAEDTGLLVVLEGTKRGSRDWEANARDAAWLTHRSARLEAAEQLSARPDLAANLEPRDREYLTACRNAESAATRRLRHVQVVIYVLLVGIISGLVSWINQDYFKERLNWLSTTRPYILSNISPYVLSVEAQRALKPGDSFRECAKDCPEMVVIPAGEFIMGSPADEEGRFDNEGPQHKVSIASAFAVSKFDVTFADWDACVSAGLCSQAIDSGMGRGTKPVINVSWDAAQQYVQWLSRATGQYYRLLTEAEWEYAARAFSTTSYFWGDEIGKGNANCDGCGSAWDNRQTSPVGSFQPNAFGLYDMAGNVWQWVQDCYHDNYDDAPADGSAWTSGDCSRRVVRGGSWLSEPRSLRSANRGTNTTVGRSGDLGFRVGRTLD